MIKVTNSVNIVKCLVPIKLVARSNNQNGITIKILLEQYFDKESSNLRLIRLSEYEFPNLNYIFEKTISISNIVYKCFIIQTDSFDAKNSFVSKTVEEANKYLTVLEQEILSELMLYAIEAI